VTGNLRRSLAACLLGSLLAMSIVSSEAPAKGAEDKKVDDTTAAANSFIAGHLEKIRPLEIEVALSWWLANTTGEDSAFARKQQLETQLDVALSDKARFAELKKLHENPPADKLLARQIEVLYLQYLGKQVPRELLEKMIAKSNAVEQAFNVYRPKVDGREVSDSEIRKILAQSNDSERRRLMWEASKEVGAVVEADLKALVVLRNEAAKQLGFKNYHAMQLYLNEQSQDQVLALFDELDTLTREPFLAAKREIDGRIGKLVGVPIDELQPWHYHDPFFQESPAVFDADLDKVFEKVDILKLCREFYAGIGLPIEDVLSRSDLYEKPGKSPHAFCTDIDREGDVRVLANIVPNEKWMATMLHELGHSVYSSKYIPRTLPYVVRSHAHILTTEGVAMMFERFSKNADWLAAMQVSVADPSAFNEAGALMRRNQLLIFSRWCQVMLRFEKSLYENPDQDLNALWWNLVEKYQGVRKPKDRNLPDYAAKIHIVSAPAYYHNYMLGQLFASQVHAALCRDVLDGAPPTDAIYVGNKRAGQFMLDKVFAPGATLSWNELTKHATGEELNAKAFAAEFRAK
jgi:peptidyl-dipeptidase A